MIRGTDEYVVCDEYVVWRSRAKGKAMLPFEIWLHILVILFYPHID